MGREADWSVVSSSRHAAVQAPPSSHTTRADGGASRSPLSRPGRSRNRETSDAPSSGRRWQKLFVLFIASAGIAPDFAQTVSMDRRAFVEGAANVYPPLVTATSSTAAWSLLLVCVVLAIAAVIARPSRLLGPIPLALAPCVWLATTSFLREQPLSPSLVTAAAVILAVWALGIEISDLVVLAYVAAAVAAFTLAGFLLFPSRVLFYNLSGTASDASILGIALVSGPFTHPNTLGLFLALGLPFTNLVSNRAVRTALIVLILIALVLSSSRTALLGAAAWLLLIVVLALPAWRATRALLGLVAALALAAIVALPLATTDPDAFTQRGAIWMYNLRAVGDDWITGLGFDWYADNRATITADLSSAAGHGHSVFITNLIEGGIVLVLLMAAMGAVAWRRSRSMPRVQGGVALAFLLTFVVQSSTETIFRFSGPDPYLAVSLLPIVVILLMPVEVTVTDRAPSSISRQGRRPTWATARR